MAKITMELLTREYNKHLKIKESIDQSSSKITYFGEKMNKKYLFENDLLNAEKDLDQALMIIIQNHIEKL
tara:strand:+ start:487 stop:696 length:210 start_codon:yes stop_codon:yes gene_type:complete